MYKLFGMNITWIIKTLFCLPLLYLPHNHHGKKTGAAEWSRGRLKKREDAGWAEMLESMNFFWPCQKGHPLLKVIFFLTLGVIVFIFILEVLICVVKNETPLGQVTGVPYLRANSLKSWSGYEDKVLWSSCQSRQVHLFLRGAAASRKRGQPEVRQMGKDPRCTTKHNSYKHKWQPLLESWCF